MRSPAVFVLKFSLYYSKKNIKLKHIRDFNDEDCPNYANITEIKRTLDFNEKDKAGINKLIAE